MLDGPIESDSAMESEPIEALNTGKRIMSKTIQLTSARHAYDADVSHGSAEIYPDGQIRVLAPGWEKMYLFDLRSKLVKLGAPLRDVEQVMAGVYRAVEDYLSSLEKTSPIVASVDQDQSNVWWFASVVYQVTGRSVPRAADEGGSHAHARLAEMEADGRARREAGKRQIIRQY